MKLILLLFFFSFLISLSISSDSNLLPQQLSMDQVVASVEHDGRRLNVWRENKEDRQRFFVTPLCEIIKNSSRCSNDKYSKAPRYVLTFRVRFWDRLTAEMVQTALNSKGFNASIDEILPLPMQMIRLNINPNVKSKVYVDNQWRLNQNQLNTMSFKLYTGSEEFCQTIQEQLEKDTLEFLTNTNLIVEFMLVAAKREYRNIKITGSTMAKSSFFSKLENNYSKNGIVYLNTDDMNKLACDVAHNVVASEEVTGNYIGTDQEDQLVNKIMDTLKEQKVLANEIQKDEWNSVFWDDIFSRPDVQTDLYNQSFTYDQGKKHFIYNEAKDKQFRSSIQDQSHRDSQNSTSSSVGANYASSGSLMGLFSGSANVNVQIDSSSSNRQVNDKHHTKETQTRDTKTISEDKMNSHLQQQGRTIRWTGEKFEPKALELYRINTRALKAKDEIAYQRVELTMVESTQKIELRPELTANNKDINELQALKLEQKRIRRMVENNNLIVVEKMNMVEKNLIETRKYSEAIAYYTKAIELKPGDADAYFNRGLAQYGLSKYNEAIVDFTKAIELNPTDESAYNNRGLAQGNLGKYNEAIADFTKAIGLDPTDADAYYSRGVAQNILGKYNEAIADSTKAIELKPGYAKAYNNRGVAQNNLGNDNEAIADYTKAIALDPTDADAYNNRGLAQKKLRKYNEAIVDYTKAIELNPSYAIAYNNRGNAQGSLGKYIEAIADYTKAIELNPTDADAYNNRGAAQTNLGKYDEAIADFKKAIELNPGLNIAVKNLQVLTDKNNSTKWQLLKVVAVVTLILLVMLIVRFVKASNSYQRQPCAVIPRSGSDPN